MGDPMSYQLWTNVHLSSKQWGTNQIHYMGLDCHLTIFEEVHSHKLKRRKQTSLSFLDPSRKTVMKCTMMLLENLAYPEWLSVRCDERILIDLVCVDKQPNNDSSRITQSIHECHSVDFIMKSQHCFGIEKVVITTPMTAAAIGLRVNWDHYVFESMTVKQLECLFSAFVQNVSPLMYISPDMVLSFLTYSSYYSQYNCVHFSLHHSVLTRQNGTIRGYLMNTKKAVTFQKLSSGNLLWCNKRSMFVSSMFVLDGENDCSQSHGDDEVMTHCSFTTCGGIARGNIQCSSLFFWHRNHKLYSYTGTRQDVIQINDSGFFLCFWNNVIPLGSKDDLVNDCGPEVEDESFLWALAVNGTTVSCSDPKQLPCKPRHPECFNLSDTCVYRLDANQFLVPCRTGGHMQSCIHFECNMNFKCPGYYCIPFVYICNGKWDCPNGYDETYQLVCGKERLCTNMFKCKQSQLCVHQNDVCDKTIDCPLGDDEFMCSLFFVSCPFHCCCLNYAIDCSHVRLINFHFHLDHFFPYLSLHMHNTGAASVSFLAKWRELVNINISNNNFRQICSHVNHFSQLVVFLANNNSVSALNNTCFMNITKHVVSLSTNCISTIHRNSFANLPSIYHIDLSGNSLKVLCSHLFAYVPYVKILYLQHNQLEYIEVDAFHDLNVLILLASDDYHVCCVKPSAALCPSEKPWHFSCEDLFPYDSRLITTSVVCSLVLVLNMVALGSALHPTDSKSGGYNIIVSFINVNDLLCGIYFLVLLCAHAHYISVFVVIEKNWRGSYTCFTVFLISFLFGISSPVSLLLLSVSRLMVVLYPMDSQFKEKAFVTSVLVFVSFPLIGLSVLGTVLYIAVYAEVPFVLCLFTIDITKSIIITVLVVVVCVVQIMSCISICTIHSALVHTMVKTPTEKPLQRSKQSSSVSIIVQLVVLTLSCILCWIPSDTILILSVCLNNYPLDMLMWTSTVVVPFNSVVNPLVFMTLKLRSWVRNKPKTIPYFSSRKSDLSSTK